MKLPRIRAATVLRNSVECSWIHEGELLSESEQEHRTRSQRAVRAGRRSFGMEGRNVRCKGEPSNRSFTSVRGCRIVLEGHPPAGDFGEGFCPRLLARPRGRPRLWVRAVRDGRASPSGDATHGRLVCAGGHDSRDRRCPCRGGDPGTVIHSPANSPDPCRVGRAKLVLKTGARSTRSLRCTTSHRSACSRSVGSFGWAAPRRAQRRRRVPVPLWIGLRALKRRRERVEGTG